jgi:hypothetical protein
VIPKSHNIPARFSIVIVATLALIAVHIALFSLLSRAFLTLLAMMISVVLLKCAWRFITGRSKGA